jgi:hypothetical protein
MMVACQWNCKKKTSQSFMIPLIDINMRFNAETVVPRHTAPTKKKRIHTRSSPTGPAEQEEGGSLEEN